MAAAFSWRLKLLEEAELFASGHAALPTPPTDQPREGESDQGGRRAAGVPAHTCLDARRRRAHGQVRALHFARGNRKTRSSTASLAGAISQAVTTIEQLAERDLLTVR